MENVVPVRELNQHTSAVLKEVQRGKFITITRSGVPIALISPLSSGSSVLDRLLAKGRVCAPLISDQFEVPRYGENQIDVASALVSDREHERY